MKDNIDECGDFVKLFEPIVDGEAFVDYLDQGSLHNPERSIVPLGSRKNKFCCPQLWQRMTIHPDGMATICCLDTLRRSEIGNVFKQSVKEIWLSDEYQRLRDMHTSGQFKKIPICASCSLARY